MTSAEEFTEFANGRTRHVVNELAGHGDTHLDRHRHGRASHPGGSTPAPARW